MYRCVLAQNTTHLIYSCVFTKQTISRQLCLVCLFVLKAKIRKRKKKLSTFTITSILLICAFKKPISKRKYSPENFEKHCMSTSFYWLWGAFLYFLYLSFMFKRPSHISNCCNVRNGCCRGGSSCYLVVLRWEKNQRGGRRSFGLGFVSIR